MPEGNASRGQNESSLTHALNTIYLDRVEHLLGKIKNRGELMNFALKIQRISCHSRTCLIMVNLFDMKYSLPISIVLEHRFHHIVLVQ